MFNGLLLSRIAAQKKGTHTRCNRLKKNNCCKTAEVQSIPIRLSFIHWKDKITTAPKKHPHQHTHTYTHMYMDTLKVCVCVCVCVCERERERERESGIHTWGWESGRWGPGAQGTMRWRRVRQRWVPQCCGCALHSGSRWVCHRPAPVPPWLAFSTLSHHILHSFHLLSLSLSLNSPHLYLFSFSFSCSRAWSCCRRLL